VWLVCVYVCACTCVWVCECVRACVRAWVRAYMCVCVQHLIHTCVYIGKTRPSTGSLSKMSPNNFGSLRRLTKVQIPWGSFTQGPLLRAPQAVLAGVFILYCSALSCCLLHCGLLGVSSAWSQSSPAVSSSIM